MSKNPKVPSSLEVRTDADFHYVVGQFFSVAIFSAFKHVEDPFLYTIPIMDIAIDSQITQDEFELSGAR
jgi:hypothetical protein